MASIEITNAHDVTVIITAYYEDLVSFIKHLKYHAYVVMSECKEENLHNLYESARRDYDAYEEALRILKAEQ